jgi:GntR family transcriptional regulator
MQFRIAFKSGRPLYLQLVDQVRHGAASGVLKVGATLPAIRPLAQRLRLNRNTVAKAYAALEALGIVNIIPGKGCFVKEIDPPFTKQVRQQLLISKIDDAIVAAHQLRINSPDFLLMAQERIQLFGKKGNERIRSRTAPSEEPEPQIDPNMTENFRKTLQTGAVTAPVTAAQPTVPAATENWSPSTD